MIGVMLVVTAGVVLLFAGAFLMATYDDASFIFLALVGAALIFIPAWGNFYEGSTDMAERWLAHNECLEEASFEYCNKLFPLPELGD